MEILKKLTENNFNEMAKLIESNQIPEELMTGNIKNELKKYKHGYSTPASINLALTHQRALKYGYKQSVKFGDHEFCECCNIRVQNEEISICQKVQPSQKEQDSYGSTIIEEFKFTSDVAFYLTFIKSCIILTLLNSLIHSIFNLMTSELFGKSCENMKTCQKIVWNIFSMPNKLDQQQWIQIVDILNLAGIIISILFFAYNRRRQYRLRAMIDSRTQSQNDYTIFVSNIPILQFPKKGEHLKSGGNLSFFYRKHLEEFFNGLITDWLKSQDQWELKKDKAGLQLQELMRKNNGELRSNDIVKSVSLCYNLSRLEVLEDIKAGLVDTYENQKDEGTSLLVNQQGESLYSQRFASIPQRIGFLNDCELVLNGQYARDSSFLFSVTHFVGQAFVTFQYEHFKEFIKQLSVQDPESLYYNGNFLKVEDACHPTDVYWQNMKVTDKYRSRKTWSSSLILGLILVISFIIMFSLQYLKQSTSQSQTGDIITLVRSYSLAVGIAVVILLVNYGLESLAITLTNTEKRKTRTDFSASVLVKTFLTELINTIVLYFFIALLLRNEQFQSKLMGLNGLVFQITTLIAVTGILHVLKSLIYPQDLICRLKRWWKYRKYQDSAVQKKFQITLNKEYQYLQFDFATRYAHYLITVYVAFFYSYLVPFAVPIICVLFFFQYWIDKFTILRRSSIRYHFGFNLVKHTSKLFESSILALALGNLIFSYYTHNFNFTIINLVSFGIAALFTLLIWTSPEGIQRIIFGEYDYNEKFTYDDCLREGKFETTYWTQNPASFLIEQEKVTGRKKAVNPAFNRKSIQGDVFISSIHD